MKIEYKHKKTKDESYGILDGFLSELQKQYKESVESYSKKWNYSKDVMDFNVSAKGFNISGNMHLYDNLVVIQGELPFLVMLYQNQLESMIKQKLKDILK
ncbi:MAG: polyhydroxyalkanoic acid system family protein [Candidatus Nanoarchaeia archaeon]|nr:polyhydroxyalkanoic acid system family protein [Candidatus Nanoarchaeia archaeon]